MQTQKGKYPINDIGNIPSSWRTFQMQGEEDEYAWSELGVPFRETYMFDRWNIGRSQITAVLKTYEGGEVSMMHSDLGRMLLDNQWVHLTTDGPVFRGRFKVIKRSRYFRVRPVFAEGE